MEFFTHEDLATMATALECGIFYLKMWNSGGLHMIEEGR